MKYNVTEAIKLASNRFKKGTRFTLPDIYPDWKNHEFSSGERGLFGIAFDRYISKGFCGIKRIGEAENGDALYIML